MHLNKVKLTSILLIILLISVSNVQALFSSQLQNEFLLTNNKSEFQEKIFDFKIKNYMRIVRYPSLVACIIKNNEIVWSKDYSLRGIFSKEQSSVDSIYGVGSVSKSITATAMMHIIENESYNVSLNDDVNKYLPFSLRNPKFPDNEITIEMILKHESSIDGIGYYKNSNISFRDILINKIDFSLEDILIPSGKYYNPSVWADEEPGEMFIYSTIGYSLFDYIVKGITGKSIEEYCQETIFKKLGMVDTSFHPSNVDQGRLAIPYSRFFNTLYKIPQYDSKNLTSSMGLRSTINDLSHYLVMHMNKGIWNNIKILNESTINLMHKINPNSYTGSLLEFPLFNFTYGMGWGGTSILGKNYEGHSGGIYGFTCYMMCNLTTKTGVIWVTNQNSKSGFPRDGIIPVLITLSLFNKAEKL